MLVGGRQLDPAAGTPFGFRPASWMSWIIVSRPKRVFFCVSDFTFSRVKNRLMLSKLPTATAITMLVIAMTMSSSSRREAGDPPRSACFLDLGRPHRSHTPLPRVLEVTWTLRVRPSRVHSTVTVSSRAIVPMSVMVHRRV